MLPPSALDGTTFYSYAPDPGGASPPAANSHAWKDGSFSFHDVLDTLNPLQHLPVISSLYRWITGDEPGNVASIVGDGIYGGPVGFGVGLFSAAFKAETGKDPGESVLAALTGDSDGQVLAGTAAPSAGAASTPTAATAATATAAATAAPAANAAAAGTAATTAASGVPVTAAAQPLPVASAPPNAFLPLFRSPPPAAASTSAGATGQAAATGQAEQAFLAQSAAYQRNLYGPRGGAPQTRPVPLQLTGPQLSFVARRPAAPTAQPATAAALPPSVPVDIPQRMMDALDKYARMQQQQEQQQRGQQVDVAP